MLSRRRTRRRTSARRRRMRGGSFMGWVKKINSFIKKNKVLSRAGLLLSKTGVPYAKQIGVASKYAGLKGYGRGGALRLAGQGRRRRRVRISR